MTPALVLSVLLLQPVYVADRTESPSARVDLLRPVAEAIAGAATTPEDAALLIALGKHESGFSRAVIEGRCADIGPLACDRGRARGVWQQWAVACRRAYAFEAGSRESLMLEARCALGNLRAAKRRCSDRNPDALAGAFSGVGGASCAAPWANERVHTYGRVVAALYRGGR